MAGGPESATCELADVGSRQRSTGVWIAGAALLLIQAVGFHGVRFDDAYITYRYGAHLARGAGLVFNPNERVFGSTSPGSMLLAALSYALVGLQLTPTVMAILGCVGWTLQAIAIYRLLSSALGEVSGAAAGLAIALGATGAAGWVSLETNLVAACLLWAFFFVGQRKWMAAVVLTACAGLLRPDAWVAAALILPLCWLDLRSRAWRPFAVFAALALPWQIFASIYYGSPVPQTAVTKLHGAGVGEYFLHELNYPTATLLWRRAPAGWVTGLVALLAVAGAVRLVRLDRRLALLVAFGALHAAAYLVLRPHVAFAWHLYPWTLTFIVCALAAVAPGQAATESVAERAARWAAFGLLIGIAGLRFVDDWRTLPGGYWTGQRDAAYRQVADYLRTHAASGDRFGSLEVGTIAYYSDLPAFDLSFLITREQDERAEPHRVRFLVTERSVTSPGTTSQPAFVGRAGAFQAFVFDDALRTRAKD